MRSHAEENLFVGQLEMKPRESSLEGNAAALQRILYSLVRCLSGRIPFGYVPAEDCDFGSSVGRRARLTGHFSFAWQMPGTCDSTFNDFHNLRVGDPVQRILPWKVPVSSEVFAGQ